MKHFKILLILSLIIIAVIAIAIRYLTALNATTITSSELNSTGNCTIANNKTSLTNNESTILCKAGESFEGFKLLKVNSFSIQICLSNCKTFAFIPRPKCVGFLL